MALTAGSLSQVSVSDVAASLIASAAVSGTTPYTYQWYRSTISGFGVASASAVGTNSLSLSDTGLTAGTVYYYKQTIVDSNATPATTSTAQLVVTTLAQQVSQNAFQEAPYLGMCDMQFNYDTMSVQFDPAGSGTIVGGQAVKFSTAVGGVPLVVPSLAASDKIAGFINYDIKSRSFNPGDLMEISLRGNVMFLFASLAINRGQQVTSLPAGVAGGCNGGVVPATGGSGFPKVGWSLDTAVLGALCRIFLETPAYSLDS